MDDKDLQEEARFLSPMLSWNEVMRIANNDGYKGSRNKPGEVARYLALRAYQKRKGGLRERTNK